MKRLLLLARSFFTPIAEGFREVVTLDIFRKEIEEPMQQQIVYAEFEEAISLWEKRTGKQVERSFSEGKQYQENGKRVTEFDGAEWKNFADFLGSREAHTYRRKCGVPLTELMRDMQQGVPDMRVSEEEDYEHKLEELRRSGL